MGRLTLCSSDKGSEGPLRKGAEVFHLQERLDWNFLDHVLAGAVERLRPLGFRG